MDHFTCEFLSSRSFTMRDRCFCMRNPYKPFGNASFACVCSPLWEAKHQKLSFLLLGPQLTCIYRFRFTPLDLHPDWCIMSRMEAVLLCSICLTVSSCSYAKRKDIIFRTARLTGMQRMWAQQRHWFFYPVLRPRLHLECESTWGLLVLQSRYMVVQS